jgi:predicted N-acetyltransferase YhbS
MSITLEQYSPGSFAAVGELMMVHWQPGNKDGNWLQPAWEYMHTHPLLDKSALHKIGVWKDAGAIVGVAHYESGLGEVYFQIHPAYKHLRPAMLDYAEDHLCGEKDGQRYSRVFVNDFDLELQDLVESRGYARDEKYYARPMSQFTIPRPFPPIHVPEGFKLKSLADENDLVKIHRVLWRGFDHEGEPPPEEIEWRRQMQSGPNFRHDLTIVVEHTATGNFVSFSGTWYEAVNKFAYVEPVATDPDFRRLGLGRAAVLEGIRRCGALGAKVAFVGADLEFYKAIGFTHLWTSNPWIKYV